jgi:hypothetical protein
MNPPDHFRFMNSMMIQQSWFAAIAVDFSAAGTLRQQALGPGPEQANARLRSALYENPVPIMVIVS